jgi:adenylate cyclase
MTRIVERTVLFADLRGSTALFETLGNAEATSVVTHCTTMLARTVSACGGHVVKTLGDGLMTVFEDSLSAFEASVQMHDTLDALVSRGQQRGASSGLKALRLQVAMARGEVVEMAGDCYGDAVNVAARLLDHAGDNETLITSEVHAGLPATMRARLRNLDRIALRGRAEPVQVHVLGGRRGGGDAPVTQFAGEPTDSHEPDALRLTWGPIDRLCDAGQMPVVLGRGPQSAFRVDDSRVSRAHARLDWHGGSFQLSDLSYNGTFVRFADGEIVSLRRGSCTLHGSGTIGLGAPPTDPSSASVQFEVLRFADTEPGSTGRRRGN